MKFDNVQIVALETFPAPHEVSYESYIEYQTNEVIGWTKAFSRLVEQTGVRRRHSYLKNWSTFFKNDPPDTVTRNQAYLEHVYPEVLRATRTVIEKNAWSKEDIAAVISVSCTGLTNPTLESLLINDLSLTPEVHWHIGYMGCHAGLVGLQSAAAVSSTMPEKIVLLVCAEASSLHYQPQLTPEIQISNALFADGCAIVALQQKRQEEKDLWSFTETSIVSLKDGAHLLTWNMSEHGWQMGLSPLLPGFIGKSLRSAKFADLQKSTNLVIHPGGKAILQAIANSLELDATVIKPSRHVLTNFGNMSSATIYFCLKEFIKAFPLHNSSIDLLAFGPGLDIIRVRLS